MKLHFKCCYLGFAKTIFRFEPEMGMEVILTGRITTWSKFKTTYQIDIDKIEIAGEGALLKIIEERKNFLSKKMDILMKYKKGNSMIFIKR